MVVYYKFGDNGGFSTVATDDVFGYTTQGYVYVEGDKLLVDDIINKSTGEWAPTETPLADDEHKANALKVAKDNVVALQSNKSLKGAKKMKKNTLENKRQAIEY